ncbi:hypothetical protein AAHA92_33695 [Salvia divinorum]|uniref:Secreted protein n=1 Tax=Salvia divinorum TaxID=28513 RepID=A0ABD1FQU7_SALDI
MWRRSGVVGVCLQLASSIVRQFSPISPLRSPIPSPCSTRRWADGGAAAVASRTLTSPGPVSAALFRRALVQHLLRVELVVRFRGAATVRNVISISRDVLFGQSRYLRRPNSTDIVLGIHKLASWC